MLLDSETGLKIKEQVLSTDGAVVNCTTLYHPLFEWRVKFLKKNTKFLFKQLSWWHDWCLWFKPLPFVREKKFEGYCSYNVTLLSNMGLVFKMHCWWASSWNVSHLFFLDLSSQSIKQNLCFTTYSNLLCYWKPLKPAGVIPRCIDNIFLGEKCHWTLTVTNKLWSHYQLIYKQIQEKYITLK